MKISVIRIISVLCIFFGETELLGEALALQSKSKPSPILPFIFNNGQMDRDISFYTKTSEGNVSVTKEGEIIYSLSAGSIAIKEKLIGGKVRKIKGEGEAATKVNYFIGDNPAKWKNNIPTYTAVNFGEVYRGIEVKLRAYGKKVEKLFYLKPRANLKDLKIGLNGAKALRVNDTGELEIDTGDGVVKWTRPIAYQRQGARGKKQEARGKRQREYVEVEYVVNPPQSSIVNRQSSIIYGFKVGDNDKTRELIIDPLLASTFVGGSDNDSASAIAIDSSGNVYIAGKTTSSNYPAYEYDISQNKNEDVFVSKFSSDLKTLISSTFVGGGKEDYASSIAIDSSGNILITGGTNSSDYPLVSGSYDTSHNGSYDVFVSKLSSDLTSLLSSTFVGGSNNDEAKALTIDSLGNILITGSTASSDYPITTGSSHNGSYDVFVSKLSSDLTSLLSSTFIGGVNMDFANTITADSLGNIYIAGFTNSSDYPTTTGSYDPSHNGENDVFISKLNGALTNLLSSTFIGGSGSEIAYGMAIFSDNIYIYIAGETNSSNYPTTSGAYEELYTSSYDVFISKLDTNISSYTLTVTTSGTGSGNVTSSSADINCGSDCSKAYESGTSVTLTAFADSGSVFTGWVGGCSGTGDCTITIDANKSVTANFNKATYTFTVTTSGTGSGNVTSSYAGINCGSDCSKAYESGTSVTLTAAAYSGSVFTGWGDGCSGTDTCTITINADTSVTANFNKTPSSGGGNGGQGGQCIFTSIYGSDLHPYVKKLREFRDKWLISNFKFTRPAFMGSPNSKIEIPNIIGKAVVKFYYKVSPRTSDYIRRYNSLKILARWMFTPLIHVISYT